MFSDLGGSIAQIAVWALPVILAVTFHEAAHGFVANALGDDTAKRAGRLTLNPLAHIDLFGTVLLPLFLILVSGFAFGYAKPVPVQVSRLGNPRRDMILVALAGPAMNIVLAVVAAIFLRMVAEGGIAATGFEAWASQMLQAMIVLNCLLAVFNMLPVPPLDGGRVAVGLLPYHLARRYARIEPVGIFLVIGLVFLLPKLTAMLGIGFDPGRVLVWAPSFWLFEGMLAMVGLS